MKKIYFLFCFIALAGCSKKETVGPVDRNTSVIVTYHFNASVAGKYYVFYTDQNSPKQTNVQITDTAWTKNDTIKTGTYKEGQLVKAGLGTLASPNTPYSLTIRVNGKVQCYGNYTANTLYADINADYPVYY